MTVHPSAAENWPVIQGRNGSELQYTHINQAFLSSQGSDNNFSDQ
jgi:hypothetical protein